VRVNKHYGAKHLCKEFPIKNWSLGGLKTFEENIDETGFIEWLKGAHQPRSVRWNDSIQ